MPDPVPRPPSLPEQLLTELEENYPATLRPGLTIRLPFRDGATSRPGTDERPAPVATKALKTPLFVEGKEGVVPAAFLGNSNSDLADTLRYYRQRTRWKQLGVACVALLAGFGFGCWYVHPPAPRVESSTPLIAPTAAEQASLDHAFEALKVGHFSEARTLFKSLVAAHPRWSALHSEIASAFLYDQDSISFKQFVTSGETDGSIPVAEARFLLGQWYLASKDFEDADRCLGESVGADPTRPDTYLFWGDCLMRWGRPTDAVEKYRAARLRNHYASTDGLYLSKLWLAEVESGLETKDGSEAEINAALAVPHPASPALFAAAARALKAAQFAQAATILAQAQRTSDPAVFRLVLLDPNFQEESWRPELAPFFGQAPAPARPAPSPAKQP